MKKSVGLRIKYFNCSDRERAVKRDRLKNTTERKHGKEENDTNLL